MHRMLIISIITTFCLIQSCCNSTPSNAVIRWEPSSEEIQKAEVIARKYADSRLKVPMDILRRVKYHAYGSYEDGKKKILFLFFDPKMFPDWEQSVAMLGGFPH